MTISTMVMTKKLLFVIKMTFNATVVVVVDDKLAKEWKKFACATCINICQLNKQKRSCMYLFLE